MFSLKTLILATSTMNLRVRGQMTGLQQQEICTVRCTPICEFFSHRSVQSKFFQDFALSALASCFNLGYFSLSVLDLFLFSSTFATFAQLVLLTTGFYLIASFLQLRILSPGYPSVSLHNPGADVILWCPIWDLWYKASAVFTPPNPSYILVLLQNWRLHNDRKISGWAAPSDRMK